MSVSQHDTRDRRALAKWTFMLPLLLAAMLVGVMITGAGAAWAIALTSIGFILLVFAEDPGLQVLLLVSAIVRYALIFLDHYYTNAILIAQDAARFVSQGAILALDSTSPFFVWRNDQSALFYELLVSRLFRIFGVQALVLQVMTVIAFLIFVVLAYRIGLALGFSSKNTLWALAFFSFLPSTIVFTSSGLREAWLLLLLSGFLLTALRILGTSKLSFKYLAAIIFTSIGLILFHKAFGLIVPAMLITLIIFLIAPRSELKRPIAWRLSWLFILLLIMLIFIANTDLQSSILKSLLSGDLLRLVDEGRNAALFRTNASTLYRVPVNASSTTALLASFPLVYLYYMAAPFPYLIVDFYDFYGSVDAGIGLLFLGLAIIAWFKYTHLRVEILFLLIVFLVISGIHAVGTITFGTAIRHRLMSLWIVAIIGMSIFGAKQVEDTD